MKTHKDLEVWKRAVDLVAEIYIKTEKFSKDELYGLTNQIRRAAVSIPSNIAEGAGRETNSEYLRFLYIARGSLMEVDTQWIIAQRIGLMGENEYRELINILNEVGRLLNGLINYRKGRD
ncbi:MAG TPA: four helix bundle protein [Edaphocola sp.]|nr:four helix bundle protein [Edaphocola sp.]